MLMVRGALENCLRTPWLLAAQVESYHQTKCPIVSSLPSKSFLVVSSVESLTSSLFILILIYVTSDCTIYSSQFYMLNCLSCCCSLHHFSFRYRGGKWNYKIYVVVSNPFGMCYRVIVN